MSLGPFLLRAAFVVCLMATMFLLLNHRWFGTYAAQFRTPNGATADGSWIGIVEAYEPNGDKILDRATAIQFKLHLDDPFVKRYQGTGKLFTRGNAEPRFYNDVHFMINSQDVLSGSVSGTTMSPDDHDSDVDIKGTFQKNKFVVSQLALHDYKYRGVLHLGNDADYQALCNSLNGTKDSSASR
ncbi:hypothetical protein [Granulicella mallensis]|nr:hypothetical protein [Granulicella mallensis]